MISGCSASDRPSSEAASNDVQFADAGPRVPEDLQGHPIDPLTDSRGRIVVLIFVRQDCPISNRYAPTLRTLHETFTGRETDFYLVYPNPSATADEIQQHLDEYKYGIPAIRDPQHVLVKQAKAGVTPEAAVFDRTGELVYHGRIDDRYVDFGKTRAEPTSHDLREALEAALANEPVPIQVTEAVGCYISDLR